MSDRHVRMHFQLLCFLIAWAAVQPAHAADSLESVAFIDNAKQQRRVEGRVLVEAQDGGIVVEGRDGRLWNITPDKLMSRTKTGGEFSPYSAKELTTRLKKEFGKRFEVYPTKNYLICSDAGKYYAQWCGTLIERLHATFYKHWAGSDLKLTKPKFPLVAIVFADRKSYANYAQKDVGPALAQSVGYFSVRSNRIVLVDLTAGPRSRPARSVLEVSRKVRRSPFNVSTVVHEATHQLAFNSGLHKRYADNPLWLTEGMAMFFETPDMRSTKGWATVGKLNLVRYRLYQQFTRAGRNAGSLKTLVAGDARLTDAKSSAAAYAESWALTYFLMKTRRKDYEKYLQHIAKKPLLIFDSAETRRKEFEQFFGDADKLDSALRAYMKRLRR